MRKFKDKLTNQAQALAPADDGTAPSTTWYAWAFSATTMLFAAAAKGVDRADRVLHDTLRGRGRRQGWVESLRTLPLADVYFRPGVLPCGRRGSGGIFGASRHQRQVEEATNPGGSIPYRPSSTGQIVIRSGAGRAFTGRRSPVMSSAVPRHCVVLDLRPMQPRGCRTRAAARLLRDGWQSLRRGARRS
jgi:hypothetical protein